MILLPDSSSEWIREVNRTKFSLATVVLFLYDMRTGRRCPQWMNKAMYGIKWLWLPFYNRGTVYVLQAMDGRSWLGPPVPKRKLHFPLKCPLIYKLSKQRNLKRLWYIFQVSDDIWITNLAIGVQSYPYCFYSKQVGYGCMMFPHRNRTLYIHVYIYIWLNLSELLIKQKHSFFRCMHH